MGVGNDVGAGAGVHTKGRSRIRSIILKSIDRVSTLYVHLYQSCLGYQVFTFSCRPHNSLTKEPLSASCNLADRD